MEYIGEGGEGVDATRTGFPGVLPDKVRAGKLWTHLETHGLHTSLWYGHDLRKTHKHHTSILAHPVPDQWSQTLGFMPQRDTLHLLTAPPHP